MEWEASAFNKLIWSCDLRLQLWGRVYAVYNKRQICYYDSEINETLTDAAVYVSNGRIQDIGDYHILKRKYPEVTVKGNGSNNYAGLIMHAAMVQDYLHFNKELHMIIWKNFLIVAKRYQ